MPAHLIERFDVEIEFDRPGLAMADEELARLTREVLLPVVDEVLDAWDEPGTVLSLPALDLDLGTMERRALAEQAPLRLRALLEDAIAAARRDMAALPVRAVAAQDDDALPSRRSAHEDALAQLAHFLRSGRMPWHAELARADLHLALLERLLGGGAAASQALLRMLAEVLAEGPAMRRLAAQFPARQLAALVTAAAPAQAPLLLAVREALQAGPAGTDSGPAGARAWTTVLALALRRADAAAGLAAIRASFMPTAGTGPGRRRGPGSVGGGDALRADGRIERIAAWWRSGQRDPAAARLLEGLLAQAAPAHGTGSGAPLTRVQAQQSSRELAQLLARFVARFVAEPGGARRLAASLPLRLRPDLLRIAAPAAAARLLALLDGAERRIVQGVPDRVHAAALIARCWEEVLDAGLVGGLAVSSHAALRARLDRLAAGAAGDAPAAAPAGAILQAPVSGGGALAVLEAFLDSGRLPVGGDAGPAGPLAGLLNALLERAARLPSARQALLRMLSRALARPAGLRRLTLQFPQRQLAAIVHAAVPDQAGTLLALFVEIQGADALGVPASSQAALQAWRQVLVGALGLPLPAGLDDLAADPAAVAPVVFAGTGHEHPGAMAADLPYGAQTWPPEALDDGPLNRLARLLAHADAGDGRIVAPTPAPGSAPFAAALAATLALPLGARRLIRALPERARETLLRLAIPARAGGILALLHEVRRSLAAPPDAGQVRAIHARCWEAVVEDCLAHAGPLPPVAALRARLEGVVASARADLAQSSDASAEVLLPNASHGPDRGRSSEAHDAQAAAGVRRVRLDSKGFSASVQGVEAAGAGHPSPAADDAPPAGPEAQSAGVSAPDPLSRLASFLRTGRWRGAEGSAQTPEQPGGALEPAHVAMLDAMLDGAVPARMLWWMLARVLADSRAGRRLVEQFPERQLHDILYRSAPTVFGGWTAMLAALDEAAAAPRRSNMRLRLLAWPMLLGAALRAALDMDSLPDTDTMRARILAALPELLPALKPALLPDSAWPGGTAQRGAAQTAAMARLDRVLRGTASESLDEGLLEGLLLRDPEQVFTALRNACAPGASDAPDAPGAAFGRLAARAGDTALRALVSAGAGAQADPIHDIVDAVLLCARSASAYPRAAAWQEVLEAVLAGPDAARVALLRARLGAAPAAVSMHPRPAPTGARLPWWRTIPRARRAAFAIRRVLAVEGERVSAAVLAVPPDTASASLGRLSPQASHDVDAAMFQTATQAYARLGDALARLASRVAVDQPPVGLGARGRRAPSPPALPEADELDAVAWRRRIDLHLEADPRIPAQRRRVLAAAIADAAHASDDEARFLRAALAALLAGLPLDLEAVALQARGSSPSPIPATGEASRTMGPGLPAAPDTIEAQASRLLRVAATHAAWRSALAAGLPDALLARMLATVRPDLAEAMSSLRRDGQGMRAHAGWRARLWAAALRLAFAPDRPPAPGPDGARATLARAAAGGDRAVEMALLSLWPGRAGVADAVAASATPDPGAAAAGHGAMHGLAADIIAPHPDTGPSAASGPVAGGGGARPPELAAPHAEATVPPYRSPADSGPGVPAAAAAQETVSRPLDDAGLPIRPDQPEAGCAATVAPPGPGAPLGERIAVGNSGLVLMAPYLGRLFSMLGLVEKGSFVDPAAAERAVLLLQFAACGEAAAPEYQLPLNKLLCGLPLDAPVPAAIALREDERAVVESLLQAMIESWSALGKTSIAGLRQTFLLRDGELELKEDAWQLTVAAGPFDMLMDRLPWSCSIVKPAWMPLPLHVSWH